MVGSIEPSIDDRGLPDNGRCLASPCSVNYVGAYAAAFRQQVEAPPPYFFGQWLLGQTDASGLQYMRNRYFDPTTGRFTQEDPLGLAGGFNLYGYAGGDPINYSDPLGLCVEDGCVLEGGAAIGAGVYIAGVGLVASVVALRHGQAIGEAVSSGIDAAGATVSSIVTWFSNKQAAKKAQGEINVINEHFDKLAGGGNGEDQDPRDRDKWKKDISRHLRELQKRIDQITGDRNKAEFQDQLNKLVQQLLQTK